METITARVAGLIRIIFDWDGNLCPEFATIEDGIARQIRRCESNAEIERGWKGAASTIQAWEADAAELREILARLTAAAGNEIRHEVAVHNIMEVAGV